MNRDFSRILAQLKQHEGKRLKPYRCTAGKLSIGYGRNLDDKGISQTEAMYLLVNDVKEVEEQLSDHKWFTKLDTVRQDALINMAFNLGYDGFMKFKNTIKHISNGKYFLASVHMLDSKWAGQVGDRAIELSDQMRTGEYA